MERVQMKREKDCFLKTTKHDTVVFGLKIKLAPKVL